MKERISRIIYHPGGDINTLEITESKVEYWKEVCLSFFKKTWFSSFTLLIVLINQCHNVYVKGTGSFMDIIIGCSCEIM